jgi:hypothetical protein
MTNEQRVDGGVAAIFCGKWGAPVTADQFSAPQKSAKSFAATNRQC